MDGQEIIATTAMGIYGDSFSNGPSSNQDLVDVKNNTLMAEWMLNFLKSIDVQIQNAQNEREGNGD